MISASKTFKIMESKQHTNSSYRLLTEVRIFNPDDQGTLDDCMKLAKLLNSKR